MNTLELNNLPTPILLVWGLPEDSEQFVCSYTAISYLTKGGIAQVSTPEGNWKLIGKLSELTEDQAKGLVHNSIHTGLSAHYTKGVNPTNVYCYKDSLESFHSAVEAEGYYFQNPMGKRYDPPACVKKPEYRQEQSFNEYEEELRKAYSKALSDWNEAQSKTLPANTLIFRRV